MKIISNCRINLLIINGIPSIRLYECGHDRTFSESTTRHK